VKKSNRTSVKSEAKTTEPKETAMKTKSKTTSKTNANHGTKESAMAKKTTEKTEETVLTAPQASTPTTATTTSSVPNAGLASLVEEISAFLDTAETRLGPESPSLTGAAKRHTAKARKGADKIIAMLAPIVQQHKLESPTVSATQMLAQQKIASTLQPLQLRLQKVQKRVGDEAFSAQNEAWATALQLYALVRSRAKSDGTLATNIAPVKAMFGYRHPDVKAAKPNKVQTRAKRKLKGAIELASKHGVAQGVLSEEAAVIAPNAGGSGGTGAAPVGTVSAPPPAAVVVSAPGVTAVTAPGASSGGTSAGSGAAAGASPATTAASPVTTVTVSSTHS
jgi:hypothetical protein